MPPNLSKACRVSEITSQVKSSQVTAFLGAFEPADTSRKGLRGREEVLEQSNTWPEQVLELLNSCWRALLESLSNTQANVRSEALVAVRVALAQRLR